MNMNTSAHYDLKKVLQLRLAELQTKNPQYSLRAYAKNLGVHAASLSEFFNDKRQFSPKLSRRIIENMGLSPDKKTALLNSLNPETQETVNIERVQIDTDNYFLVSDPLYYSVLCLIETKDFKEDYAWMAQRLKSTEDQVRLSIERMTRLNLLKRDEQGNLAYNMHGHLGTTDDVANASLRLRHSENLEAAKDALINLPVSERYFNFETLAVSKEMLPEIKKLINECRSKIVAIASEGQKDEVYEFCFNFFPRTFNENTEEETKH